MRPLDGVDAKLARAKEHIDGLLARMNADGVSQTFGLVEQLDLSARQRVLAARFPEAVALKYAVIVGDALQNLRASLDHLVWRLVEANEQTPGRNNAFPIKADLTSYRKAAPTSLKGVAPRAAALVEQVQPFQAGATAKRQPLWVLDALAQIDKHRVLHIVAMAVAGQRLVTDPARAYDYSASAWRARAATPRSSWQHRGAPEDRHLSR